MEPELWTDASRTLAARVARLGHVAPMQEAFANPPSFIRGRAAFRLTGELRAVGHDRVLTTPCVIQPDDDNEG